MNDIDAAPDDVTAGASRQPTVLCVDDEPNILSALRRAFRSSGYRVLVAGSGPEALDTLRAGSVDLVISDMRMPGMDGAQLLERVRLEWPSIGRILLTGHADVASTVAAINRGEIFRYIAKPWQEGDLLQAVAQALERQSLLREKSRLQEAVARHNAELSKINESLERKVDERTDSLRLANARLDKNYLNSIKALSGLIEMRGSLIAGHSRRVADMARQIAVTMGLSADAVQDIFVAGLLQDVGQVALSDEVLATSVSRLSLEQRVQYERHPLMSEQALLALDDMQRVAVLVRSHHERHDGKGFPGRMRGDDIPIGSRILALADAFDDMQSAHLARVSLTAVEARVLIERGSGGQFDPAVVDAFLECTRVPVAAPTVVYLRPEELLPGMILAEDLRSRDGMVLLAAQHVMGADLIARIVLHEARYGLNLSIPVKLNAK